MEKKAAAMALPRLAPGQAAQVCRNASLASGKETFSVDRARRPKTPMPGFASQLNDIEIWNLIQFLDAQAEARNALAMTDRVKPLRPVFAPDFTFEIIGRAQESLERQARTESRCSCSHAATVAAAPARTREQAACDPGGGGTRDCRADQRVSIAGDASDRNRR